MIESYVPDNVLPTQSINDRSGQDVAQFRQFSRATFLLVCGDILAVQLSLFSAVLTRNSLHSVWPINVGPHMISRMALGLMILPLSLLLLGLHPGYGVSPVEKLRKRIIATVCVYAALIFWAYIFNQDAWSRGILAFSFLYTLILLPVFGATVRNQLIKANLWGRPVVIVGANEVGLAVERALRSNPMLGLVPVGFFDDRKNEEGRIVGEIKISGRIDKVKSYRSNVRTAIIALPDVNMPRLHEIVSTIPFSDVIFIPNLLGFQTLWISAQDFNGILGLCVKRNLLLPHNRIVKRVTDLFLGSALFLTALPFIGFFAALIKVFDPGPAFYTQARVGEDGRVFQMFKLRSMYTDAEQRLQSHLESDAEARCEWERYMKLRNDPRILPVVGRLMRRLSIDELPQLWHVVTGEMTLVGPRPFPKYHVKRFSPEFQKLRASVRPGLTGLWQVSSRSEGDLRIQEAQDTYFIRNWSLWLDLYILLRTTRVVLGGRGAR